MDKNSSDLPLPSGDQIFLLHLWGILDMLTEPLMGILPAEVCKQPSNSCSEGVYYTPFLLFKSVFPIH